MIRIRYTHFPDGTHVRVYHDRGRTIVQLRTGLTREQRAAAMRRASWEIHQTRSGRHGPACRWPLPDRLFIAAHLRAAEITDLVATRPLSSVTILGVTLAGVTSLLCLSIPAITMPRPAPPAAYQAAPHHHRRRGVARPRSAAPHTGTWATLYLHPTAETSH